MGKGGGITQYAQTPEQPLSRTVAYWASVLISHCAFLLRHFFLAHGFESLLNHILIKFSAPLDKIFRMGSRCTVVHCSTERQNRRNQMSH